jgi:hypothetical protein
MSGNQINAEIMEFGILLLRSLTERYVYHCGWVSLRPSDSEFSQNWKPGTGEIIIIIIIFA